MTRILASLACCLLFQFLLTVDVLAKKSSSRTKSSKKVDWKVFTSPGKETRVLMPGDISQYFRKGKKFYSDQEQGITRFEALLKAGKPSIEMIISPVSGHTLSQQTQFLKADFKSSAGFKVKDVCECQGIGWKGKIFTAENSKRKYTSLVAMDPTGREVVYIETALPTDSKETRKMFDSLVIDSTALKAKQAKFKKDNMSVWKTFYTPYKDVKIKLPAPVKVYKPSDEKTQKSDSRQGIERYRAYYGPDAILMITSPVSGYSLKEHTKDYKKQFNEKDGYTVRDLGECEGSGWTGSRFSAHGNGINNNCLVALDPTERLVIYLESTFIPGDNLTKEMIDSLVIDGKKIREKRNAKTKEYFDKIFSPKSPGQIIGIISVCLGSLLLLVGGIWMLVAAFQTHWGWGVGILIFHTLGSLCFLAARPRRAWIPFVISLFGWVFLIVGIFSFPESH